MNRCVLLAFLLLTAFLPLAAQDKDNDGIPDEVEMRLGMDPETSDELVLICDDKSTAEGDKTIGPKQDKAFDVTKIYFGSAAEDRYVWRLDFAQPPVLSQDIALILYLDADNNPETGRKDSAWAKGVDVMLRPGSLSTFEYDTHAEPKPWTTYVVDGNHLYMVADLRLHQEGGKSVYRAYLLSQNMVKADGKQDDNDRTDWIAVTGPGRSSRKRIGLPGIKPEGVIAFRPRRVVRRGLERNPENAVVEPKAFELKGFAYDPKYEVVNGGAMSGSSVSFASPVEGSYRLGLTMSDDADGNEDVTILVDGRKIGRAVADQNDNGVYFFETEQPADFEKGGKVTFLTGQPVGYYRIGKVVFLKELLKPDAMEIRDVAADTRLPDEPTPTARITWITTLPASSILEYGKRGEQAREVRDESFRNNHRVVLRDLEPDTDYEFVVRAAGARGEKAASEKMSFSTKPVSLPPGAAKRKRVVLTLQNPLHFDLKGWPAGSGVPIPQGDLASVEGIRLLGPNGKEVPCQVELLGRWLDQTVKWALVLFDADVPADGKAGYVVEYGSEVKRQPVTSKLFVSETPTLVTVRTGPLQFTVDKERFGLFREIRLDRNGDGQFADEELLSGGDKRSAARLTDKHGKVFSSLGKPAAVTVEESGPMRATIGIEGDYVAEDGSKLYTYVVRIHAYAGKGFVRMFYTFGNNAFGDMFSYVNDLSLTLPLRLTGARTCRLGGDGNEMAVDLAATPEVRLFQDFDDQFQLVAKGKPAQPGKRAGGWAALGDGQWATQVAVRDFWQMYPKDLTVTPDAISVGILPRLNPHDYDAFQPLHHRLYFHLLNGVYKLHTGIAKRHELLLDFHASGEAQEAGRRVAAFQADPFPAASPEWYCESKAFGDIVPARAGEFDEYEAMVAKGFDKVNQRRVSMKEYGWHNFGDWYGERQYNWGNIEYDIMEGLFLQFARTGNADYFRLAVDAARHNMDIDTIHYAANPNDVGKVHVHSLCHTGGYYTTKEFPDAIDSGGYNSGHLWNRGLFHNYYLTGDRRSGEVARIVSEAVARELTTNFSVGNHAERDTAWPLIASMTAYEATGDRFFLNSAKIMVTDVLCEQDPVAGNWQFPAGYSKVVPPPIGGYAWCCGLLICGLEMYYHQVPDDRVKRCILRAAEWLIRDEWIAARNGFRATSCPTFNDKTSAGGASWSCGPALAIAYQMSGNRKFLDIGLKGHCYAIRSIPGIGKSYAQDICFSPNLIYDLKGLGITDVSTERYEPPVTTKLGGTPVMIPGEKPAVSVLITCNRKKGVEGEVSIVELPKGWTADAERKTFAIVTKDQSVTVAFALTPAGDLAPGTEYRAVARMVCAGQTQEFEFKIRLAAKASLGDKIGLIAGEEDFLAPALRKAGVAFVPIRDVRAGLGEYRLILVGTQAHTLDAAGIASSAPAVWEYVKSGGAVALSQMNDDKWSPGLLPGGIVLSEEDSESGKIADSRSPIFAGKTPVTDASGMKIFDSIEALGPEWRILLTDERGRPAIAEARAGYGRLFLFEPSVERYYSGALAAPDEAKREQYRRLFENILAYLQSNPTPQSP